MIGAGLRIVENVHMTTTEEDWSRVRSPSRALRRMRRGHRQNVRVLVVPRKDAVIIGGVAHMHPETARACRALMADFSERWAR